jgi:hypothetical protein
MSGKEEARISNDTADRWWEKLPYSGEFWGHEACPWNPFPPNSRWGHEIDVLYRRDRSGTRKRVVTP